MDYYNELQPWTLYCDFLLLLGGVCAVAVAVILLFYAVKKIRRSRLQSRRHDYYRPRG